MCGDQFLVISRQTQHLGPMAGKKVSHLHGMRVLISDRQHRRHIVPAGFSCLLKIFGVPWCVEICIFHLIIMCIYIFNQFPSLFICV